VKLGWALAGCILALLATNACSGLHAYSRRAGQNACKDLYQCTVYDDSGRHEVPCYYSYGLRRYLYPGDQAWPFEPGVCPVSTADG
jgi:hypothetical protein